MQCSTITLRFNYVNKAAKGHGSMHLVLVCFQPHWIFTACFAFLDCSCTERIYYGLIEENDNHRAARFRLEDVKTFKI